MKPTLALDDRLCDELRRGVDRGALYRRIPGRNRVRILVESSLSFFDKKATRREMATRLRRAVAKEIQEKAAGRNRVAI